MFLIVCLPGRCSATGMRKQFPRIDAALRPSPSRTPLLALIATKQPSSRSGSTSIVAASEKRESTFDSIRRNVEQVMLNQASAKASTDMLVRMDEGKEICVRSFCVYIVSTKEAGTTTESRREGSQ